MVILENQPVKIWKILRKKEKIFVSFLLILTILLFLEFLSISSIVPFLNELVGGLEENIVTKNLEFLFEDINLEKENKFRILILVIIFVFLIKNFLFVLNTYFQIILLFS